MPSAADRRRIAAMSCASCSRAIAARPTNSTSSRARCRAHARRWSWCAPASASIRGGYRTEPRLAELSFGGWEGFTYADLRQQEAGPRKLAERERDKWNFVPPGGESYAQLLLRIQAWHATLDRDSVVVSHGGVARTLFVHFGLLRPAVAPVHDVDQGVVYELATGKMVRYA